MASQQFDDSEDSGPFRRRNTRQRQALSHELFHGLSPEEFNQEAKRLAELEALTPQVRARMKAQLIERLKTPVDAPTWGPDWVKHGERVSARAQKKKNPLAKMFSRAKDANDEGDEFPVLTDDERDDAQVITRNMEKSRQVAHYRPLYAIAIVLALGIALLAMFVDYQIIRGDVWTRALSNEFMVVPASLQTSVIFKSMQVLFAVLIVHFMLRITGAYGRNALITAGFVFALVMVGCLGYLVAYNNMSGATSARYEQHDESQPQTNSIDRLFASDVRSDSPRTVPASERLGSTDTSSEYSLPLPKISQTSLANADSWVWLAFASVIFFIVTTVAALYMQTVENNVRNFHIARDYRHRQKQFTQLHLLELADGRQS
jgi:hypothetical protein